MARVTTFSIFLLLVSAVAPITFLGSKPLIGSAGVKPSKDPFYELPQWLDRHEPGTVLRHRRTPSSISAFGIPHENLQTAHQILYRTTDNRGKATATVLTVLIPHNADYTKVLSFQAAENAATIDCAPSFGFQVQSTKDPLLNSNTTQGQLLFIGAALAQGWVAISPDYLGPKGSFGAVKLGAYATLDGIRAAINSASFTGISNKPNIAMWGYSAGGFVTFGATLIRSAYAPELEIDGAAVGGIGSMTTFRDLDVISTLNKQPTAFFIALAVLGLASQYPSLGRAIDEHLKPQNREKFYQPLHQCLEAIKADFKLLDVLDMFDDPNFLAKIPSILSEIARDNTFPDVIPGIPLFWYQYALDDLIPSAQADALVRDYCSKGATIEYHVQNGPGLDHTQYGIIGAPEALDWLKL
ncbi:secretory lipase domain-containing protein [Hirsutella rhossiliensis]|uniref:Secretory lipase domain-containing protein n=1 Tax=Hirsutella rhossiliensis TaxID=111463 RepID=A0A9P8N5D8_9HYPO|nr:secretory lipase domain-containing protein [Hirsutella rhossiliensis]KAH0966922.1 secretory lipase domain-containing protein [Hirsutella rhossiliensis]